MKKQSTTNRAYSANASPQSTRRVHQAGPSKGQANTCKSVREAAAIRPAFRSIVVPLDGTHEAEHALPHALAIARRTNAVLRLVHVDSRLEQIEPQKLYYNPKLDERRMFEMQDYLLDVANRIALVDQVKVETILVHSNEIEDSLLKMDASTDLFVLASRRRGIFRRLWTASVADTLRRSLNTPALFVRGYSAPVDLTGDPIARHILVPLNGSASAERIISTATVIASFEDALLTLLNIQNDDWTRGSFEHINPSGYLKAISQQISKSLPVIGASVVTTDKTVPAAIATYAEQRKVDLIALAASSNNLISDFWRGSLAEALFRRTNLPILFLRNGLQSTPQEVASAL